VVALFHLKEASPVQQAKRSNHIKTSHVGIYPHLSAMIKHGCAQVHEQESQNKNLWHHFISPLLSCFLDRSIGIISYPERFVKKFFRFFC
jgi:hypothetical protein